MKHFHAATSLRARLPVPVSGKVFDAEDVQYAVDASLDFWLTTGRFAEQFERQFARVMGVRDARLVNSGSSANLVALFRAHFFYSR